jgi:hypothetical protein
MQKMALIMFYPFRALSDLTCIGESYWKMFNQELTSHHNKEDTKFWKKVFDILQNIQDRLTLQKHLKCPQDPIFMTTVNEKSMKKRRQKANLPTKIKLWTYCKWGHNSS